ncbi:MAG: PKD domain-containing protein, partial [Deltaproteobacteria bacterium]|nr:PKD domain-containing protein [Deltaproteobacteria bacterium]
AALADDDIVLVPFAPNNLELPHPVHENARITLKGIVRNASCGSYRVIWDTDRDGAFETDGQDAMRSASPWNGTLYDISVYYEVPDVPGTADQRWPINVQVYNNCTGKESLATYKLFVYNWSPTPDPRAWKKDQIDVMSQVAIQESLWYLHRRMVRSGTNAQMTGYPDSGRNTFAGAALAAWAFSINGHGPAFPTAGYNTYGFTMPDNWSATNKYRWDSNPYAETVARIVNQVLANGTGWVGINGADESSECGVDVLSTGSYRTRNCNRLPGTTNNSGAYTNGASNNVYYHGVSTSALASVLPSLVGTPLQTGGLAGMRWENFIQELTDYMGYMQIDGGCADGGWYYSAFDGGGDCIYMDASTAQWAYIGLESAEVLGRPFGVIVTNRHKYRSAYAAVANLNNNGAAQYRTSGHGTNNLMLTGGSILVARWLEFDKLPTSGGANNATPFPYSGYRVNDYRQAMSKMRSFTSNNWTSTTVAPYYNGGLFWSTGSYLCGNTSSVYRWSGSGCGNLYAIYSHQKAYRTGIPEELSPRVLDGFTWDQQFAISTMRAQYRDRGDFDNGNWGYIHDCDVGSMINCNYGGVSFSTAVGVLILTPTLFNPKPVALASITPAVVYEGCSNSNASTLTFNHSASFHPSPDARIVAYQWDVDKSANGGGLWWNTPGARADFEVGATHTTAGGQVIPGASVPFIYSYQRSGSYVATLRVVDSTNQEKLTELPVTVLPVPNEAPSVNHGGPYILEAGDALTLRGSASDNNAGCGDTLSVAWDLDGDNAFNDLSAAAGTIPWSKFSAFQYGRAYNIKLRARDSAGAEVSTITQLTIYPKEPVAVATAVPNPAQCQQEISFSGANSFHLNPNRRITQYAWDVDANLNPGVDGGGVRFAYAYPRFGTYDVTLKVTDDLGRSHTVSGLKVNVNQGNSAPVARVAAARVTRIELQDIVLDASPSYDANASCGDAITRYEWDLDGDGRFGGARDVTTQQSRVVLPWADASVRLGWNGVDLSLQRRLTARVTDTFGAQSTAQVELTVYKADPVARFDQRPSPAPIDLQTGLVQVTLDARESYSPIPTGAITNYEWDFDCADNAPQFVDAVGQPVVTYRRIFENVSPNSVPRPLVCLRVTDHRGTKVWIQKPILYGVGDVPPTADADPSDSPEVGYHVLLGGDLRLSGAQSIEPNKDDFIKFYRWRVNYSANENPDTLVNWDVVARDDNGDGLEAVSAVTAARLAQLGVGALGTYPLVMEVEDTTFLSARDRSTLTVHPVNPVASAVVDPTVAACGQRLTLDASASGHSHPFIDIVEWAWDMNNNGSFNDAVDARGERTTVTASQFTFNGPVPVMLRVTDSEGHQATTQVNLAVTQGNSAPSANAGGPYVVAIGDAAVALNGGGTVDPNAQCGDAVVSLRWDIGNNGTFEAQYDNNPTPTLTWQQLTQLLGTGNKGRYAVRLQARDRFGATSEHVVNLDIVQGPTALAAVTPSRPACNAQVELNGGGSSTDGPLDNGFALVRYQWDLTNDGTFDAEGVSVLRNAVGDGPVTARLRVTDASNRTSEATAVYTISNNNLPPVGNAGGPYATTILNGVRQPVTLDARATVDPNAPCDAVARYEWDTDNDGLFGANDTNGVAGVGNSDAVGALVENHVNSQWRVGLSYIVRLRTCDTKGACSVVEADLTVSDNAPPTGEIVYPRASDCVANVQFPLQIKLKDLEGGAVTVRVLVDNVSVHQSSVQVQPNVQKTHTITLDAGRFAEGFRALTVEMVDDRNGRSVMNSGGPVPFDRTAPSLSISSALIANACYRLAEVPSLNIAASDAVDPAPIIHETTTANSCRRLLSVEAVDRCGNRKVIDRQYRVAEAVPFTLNGPAEGSLVGSGAFTWALDESCANPLSATLAEAGATRAYAAGALINVPGAYTFTLNVPNCVGEVVQARRAFTVNAPP